MNPTTDHRIFCRQEEERRLLHGLACEWERFVWILDASHRNPLRPPLFSLRDLKGRWAQWSGEKREISFSREFVLTHSWGSVREVLLHEMAHQLAEEVLGGRQETAHGPAFQKACHLLRANPRAGVADPLDGPIPRESPSAGERILGRVRKLLALAESPDRHEAEAAMAKAHALICKYNLPLRPGDGPKAYVSFLLGEAALRHFAEDYALANLLQDFYFVRGIWVSCYVPRKGKMGRALEISGTVANVKIAAYVFEFVRRFIAAKWEDYGRGRRLNRYRLTDFALGILEGFRAKMETNGGRPTGREKSGALVRREDPFLREYVAYRYPRLSTIRTGGGGADPGVRRDGERIGRDLVISKAVMEGAESRGFLLPP